jgi:UDP-N-acetylglucosamine pyrophosphorylase
MMAAGGISARMGGTSLRGLLPVGPVTGKSLFRLQAEKIIALRRRFGADLRWLVMTSSSIHAATQAAFERERIDGEAEFIQQTSLPIVDKELQPIYSTEGEPVMFPTGHGGMFQALAGKGVIEQLIREGVEHLFFFQYPNLLENICDPVMLGYHHAHNHEVTLKGFTEYAQDERVGRIVEMDAGLRVVEYYYVPRPNRGLFDVFPANMGTYVISVELLRRCAADGVALPWHCVALNSPPVPSARWKVEQFVFDLLMFANRAGLILCDRRCEYAPIKAPEGRDSLQDARARLLGVYRQWLAAARAEPRFAGARVEISPLFALGEADVVRGVKPGTIYEDGAIFQ